MSHESLSTPAPKRPYEIFGLTEGESLNSRITKERFDALLEDEQTFIHDIKESNNTHGEFLFVTTSRPGEQNRICITFYGLGYHEHRERWIDQEWFWYQSSLTPELFEKRIKKEAAKQTMAERLANITPSIEQETAQTAYGMMFELLADLTDEDGALAEMEDIDYLGGINLFFPPEEELNSIPSPTGENLLDQASREKLPPLYANEEKGLEAQAQVKFFTPDSNWTWYASEFDGEDIFFGLVSGFEVELGYFSLKELKEVTGPLGLQIERDLYFEPKTLKELMEKHERENRRE